MMSAFAARRPCGIYLWIHRSEGKTVHTKTDMDTAIHRWVKTLDFGGLSVPFSACAVFYLSRTALLRPSCAHLHRSRRRFMGRVPFAWQ